MSRLFLLVLVLGALVSATAFAADDWKPPNLARNPSFETVDAAGAPADWGGDPAVYSTVTSPTHQSARALQWVNADPKRYVLCSQTVPLKPGRAYEVRVWVKTENVQGEETGATICLEWADAKGKWIGGHYPEGVKGTSDWQQIRSISPPVPKEAAACTVTCYVRQGMTGKAWWDGVEVRQWRRPALETMLVSPNYRGQIGPHSRRINLRVATFLEDYDLQPRDVALRADILAVPDGRRVLQERRQGDVPGMVFDVPGSLPPGKYELRVTLERKTDGREIGADSWRLRVLAPGEASQVSAIDAHNRLIVAGRPFFPLGMYWGGITEEELRIYAQSAFNCLMPYGAPDQAQMDLAQKLGLKVIYSVKDIYYGSAYCPADIKTAEDERRFIAAKAQAFRRHPALLAWYLNDELSPEYVDRLEAHQQWMEDLDPDHPTWAVLYQVGELSAYRRTCDAIGTDPYPIPGSPARMAGDWARMSVAAMHDSRPVWMVPQMMNWGCYRNTEEEKRKVRPPTPEEMRSMAWQCIAHGARGLIFYSWFDLRRDQAAPFAQRWPQVQRIAQEIRDLAPVILSVEPPPAIRAPRRPWLHWATRRVGDKVYLIAVNDEPRSHRLAVNLGRAPRSVALRGAKDPVASRPGPTRPSSARWLTVELPPFGVNVYEVVF